MWLLLVIALMAGCASRPVPVESPPPASVEYPPPRQAHRLIGRLTRESTRVCAGDTSWAPWGTPFRYRIGFTPLVWAAAAARPDLEGRWVVAVGRSRLRTVPRSQPEPRTPPVPEKCGEVRVHGSTYGGYFSSDRSYRRAEERIGVLAWVEAFEVDSISEIAEPSLRPVQGERPSDEVTPVTWRNDTGVALEDFFLVAHYDDFGGPTTESLRSPPMRLEPGQVAAWRFPSSIDDVTEADKPPHARRGLSLFSIRLLSSSTEALLDGSVEILLVFPGAASGHGPQ